MRRAVRDVVLGSGLLPETRVLLDAMTTPPSSLRARQINALIRNLIVAGIWSRLDLLYVLAAHSSQAALLNWKNPGTFTAIEVNSPTFTVDRGYTGDGATSRLRTQFVPSTNGVSFTQDNASIWAWSLTDAAASIVDVGNSSGAPSSHVITRSATGNLVVRLTDATNGTTANAASLGLHGGSRASSTTRKNWKNGAQLGADISVTSTGLPTQEQWICAGNATSFSTKQIAMAAWAASLTGLEAAFYNAMLPYMQGVGAA